MHSDDSDNAVPKRPDSPDTIDGGAPNFQEAQESFFARPEDLIGKSIGKVKLLEIVGKGGFGVVYRGHHTGLNRDVAVKFLHRALDEESLKRFHKEAENIAALDKHPAVVTVYDEDIYRGLPYFVLEYVDSNAKDLLQESGGQLDAQEALRVASQIASALEWAHGQGLIHRDVKPANILIEKTDLSAKLADFGLARLYVDDDPNSTRDAIRGTPPYMSPEQIRGEELDGRTDIYSLGVTLYELLCGGMLYEGESSSEVIENIRQNKRTPLQRRKIDLPSVILDVVDKATAYDRKDRYPSASEFKKDIESILNSIGTTLIARKVDLSTRRFTRGQKVGLLTVGSLALVTLVAFAAIFTIGRSAYGGKLEIADSHLENGRLAQSAKVYEELLAESPDRLDARYGLGYALLLQGQLDDASSTFAELTDESLKHESALALAWIADQEQALAITEASPGTTTAYFQTVAARLDLLRENHEGVLERLDAIEQSQFRFKWQYAEGLEMLGRALKAAQRIDEAESTFQRMATIENGTVRNRAGDYIASIALEQAKTERMRSLRNRMQGIREAMVEKGYTPPTVSERWRSRPIRYTTVATRVGDGAIALEYGLAERLPVWLERQFSAGSILTPLSRVNLDDILLEQEIALELATNEGAIQLGQLLASRISIEPRLSRFGDQEQLEFRIVDNETSASYVTEELSLTRPLEESALVEAIETLITDVLFERYPVRATLHSENGRYWIDVGSAVGVKPGDSFVLLAQPELRAGIVVPGYRVEVRGAVDAQQAEVELIDLNGEVSTDLKKDTAVVAYDWYRQVSNDDE